MGLGLAQVGMETIEIQNQLAASGKGEAGALTLPDLCNFPLFKPLKPLYPQAPGSGQGPWPGLCL